MSAPECPLRIAIVVGTRPNFMKAVPVVKALRGQHEEFKPVLIHTGQHYDDAMSKVFLDQFGVGAPDHFLMFARVRMRPKRRGS